MTHTNRRKQLIIDPVAQKRQIGSMIWTPFLMLGVAAAITVTMSLRLLYEADTVQAELPSLKLMIVWLMVFLAGAAGAIVLQAVKFSNRIAGPSYRMRKSLARVREGDFSIRVRLRVGDELIPLAEEMNRVLEWLEARESGVEPAGDQPDAADSVAQVEETEAPEPVS